MSGILATIMHTTYIHGRLRKAISLWWVVANVDGAGCKGSRYGGYGGIACEGRPH